VNPFKVYYGEGWFASLIAHKEPSTPTVISENELSPR
jgi:hypothetical protein